MPSFDELYLERVRKVRDCFTLNCDDVDDDDLPPAVVFETQAGKVLVIPHGDADTIDALELHWFDMHDERVGDYELIHRPRVG